MVSKTDLNGSHDDDHLKKIVNSEKVLSVKDDKPEEEVLLSKNGKTPEKSEK